MNTDQTSQLLLHKFAETGYSSTPGIAGDAGIGLDGFDALRFDFEAHCQITLLTVAEVDELILAAIVGFEATEAILRGDDEAQPLATATARQLSHIARLGVICNSPVRRDKRLEMHSTAALLCDPLVEDGFGEQLARLRDRHLESVLDHLAPGPEGLTIARDTPLVARAVRLGRERLDEYEASWERANQIVADLPDPNDTTVQEIVEIDSPGSGAGRTPALTFSPLDRKPVVMMGDLDESADRPEKSTSWTQPLIWALFRDEELLPADDEFEGAVTITQRRTDFELTVARPNPDRPVFARVVETDNLEICSVAALLPNESGWSGVMPIPETFDPERHRIEIVDEPIATRWVPSGAEAAQKKVLEVANEIDLYPEDFPAP